MEESRFLELPSQELGRISEIFDDRVAKREVETGYDLRWVHDELQSELDEQLEASFLAGQVVRVYYCSPGEESDHLITIRDANGVTECYPAGYSLVGTLEGLALDPVFADHAEEPVPTFACWDDAIAYVEHETRVQDDLRTESLAVPLPTDGLAVEPSIALLIQPFSLPLGSRLDPDTAVAEIPRDLVVTLDFPERESPFAADQNTLLQQYYNLLYRADAVPEEAPFVLASMERVLESLVSVLAGKNPASFRSRMQFAVADREQPSYLLYDEFREETLEISRVRRFGAYFLGYEVALPEVIDLDADEPDVPELYAMVQVFGDDDDETGGLYVGLPFSDIIEAQCEETRLEDVDQGLFDAVRNEFYEQLQCVIDRNPYDHEAILAFATDLVGKLNNGVVADVDYEEHRAIVLQLDRDSGGYELGEMQPGTALGSSDEQLQYRGPLYGGAQVAESYPFECNLVGYYLHANGVMEDTDIACEVDDFDLVLVLSPAPDSVFRHFEGNVVLTSINAVVNARFKISPHASN